MNTDVTDLTLTKAVRALRAGDITSQELTLACLERIERLDSILHAFLYVNHQGALEQAVVADQRLQAWQNSSPGNRETLPALLGVPIAVKDVLTVQGIPCTAGSRILEGFIPPFNATTVDHLLAAGVIIVGKTNTDEFAMGSSTENSAYGVTHNPWDTNRVPGGSSGGSAAAVAARMVPVALGSDTGGSVRQPASFCGITGLKPTYGRTSRYGLIAYGSSLDTVGALGRTAEDVATLFTLMAGRDQRDATTVDLPVPKIELNGQGKNTTGSLANLRVGVPQEFFIAGIQPEVEKAVREAVRVLESLGAQVKTISLPHTEYALPVYYLIAPAEASANLARFDGIRYGPRTQTDGQETGQNTLRMWDVFRKTRGARFGPEVKRRIMLGTYALSAGYYDAFYGQAQKVRTLIKQDFENTFQKVDVIAAPVAPTTAFRIGEHNDDPLAMYLEDIFTLTANLAGVPGLAFPVGFDKQGLPIGMQLMGPHFQEQLLFQTAHTYQQVTNWHERKPGLD
jgi:aspartyl-tRNA(Asn)/glutamyl-tRNA(Gln) amidotransferase subunit A